MLNPHTRAVVGVLTGAVAVLAGLIYVGLGASSPILLVAGVLVVIAGIAGAVMSARELRDLADGDRPAARVEDD